MRKRIFWVVWVAAPLVIAQACAEARAETPNPINVVVEQAGDSARIIVAWGASQPGTYPISHYWLRLIHPGGEDDPDVLEWSQTTYTVDTLYYPWASGDDLFRVGVQAEDVQGDTTSYVWSDAFQLIEPEPYRPPGDPGVPTVTIDTGDFVVLDGYRSFPETGPDLPFKFKGSAVMEGRWYAGGDLIACRRVLLAETADGISAVGNGLCDTPVVPVDRVYDSRMHEFTTPQELTANLVWEVYARR